MRAALTLALALLAPLALGACTATGPGAQPGAQPGAFSRALLGAGAPARPALETADLREGMTKAQVRAALGEPRSVSDFSSGRSEWEYRAAPGEGLAATAADRAIGAALPGFAANVAREGVRAARGDAAITTLTVRFDANGRVRSFVRRTVRG